VSVDVFTTAKMLACGKGGRVAAYYICEFGRFLGGQRVWPVKMAAVGYCLSDFVNLAILKSAKMFGLLKRVPFVATLS